MSGLLSFATPVALLMFATAGVGAAAQSQTTSSGTTDFSGHWQVDAAKSVEADEHTQALDIVQNGEDVSVTRHYRENGAKELTTKFTCTVNGKECSFDENGHKSKVSLWYNGPVLVILKTDGPKHDNTVEWHLSTTDGGRTLTVKRQIMDASSQKPEQLVLERSDAVASR